MTHPRGHREVISEGKEGERKKRNTDMGMNTWKHVRERTVCLGNNKILVK